MTLLRTKLAFAIFGCTLAAFSSGCTSPFASPPRSHAVTESPARPAVPNVATPAVTLPAVAESEPDMTGVLDKLQQVREIDPAAEQKLLEELRRTPAKSWPLVAEQFRASLAYRERLATKELTKRREGAASSEPHVIETGYDSISAPPAQSNLASSNSRPSAPIGTLVDPRNADADGVSSEAVAKSTPYSTPDAIAQSAQAEIRAPREFATNDKAFPISSARETSTGEVVQARLDTIGEPMSSASTRTSAEDLGWQQLVEQAATNLNKRVAASPSSTAEVHQHATLRMLWLLAGDTEKALEPIPHIAPGEQDYWSQQLFALATYLDHHSQPDDKRRAAAAVIRLDDAVTSLRELGSLTLRNLSFCKNVYGFGSIETFDADRFSPGENLALYVEVENYHSRSTEKGFCTSLGSTYELLDDQGERVSGGTFPDVDDCCQSRRRDFHIQYGLTLPDKIAPGRYTLELLVKDRQSDKIGHAAASFEIRGGRFDPINSPKRP